MDLTYIIIIAILCLLSLILAIINFIQNRKTKKFIEELNIVQGKTLEDIFRDYVQKSEVIDSRIQALEMYRGLNEKRMSGKLGRIGFKKYNPYGDTGGAHSFSVAILDDKLSGVVFTTLFRRGETTSYAKHILNGNSEVSLTEEEQEVLIKAKSEKT